MNQTTKVAKHFPITNKTRHESMRVFLLSQTESECLRLLLADCLLYPHLLLSLTYTYLHRMLGQQTRFLVDGVFACLLVASGRANPFLEMTLTGTGNGGRWWAKHRLWDRPFGGSKLRQQGSPTIFEWWLSPTISPVFIRHSRESGIVARQARRFTLPEFTQSLRGNHDR